MVEFIYDSYDREATDKFGDESIFLEVFGQDFG
jgi:hypothetical protein